MDPLTWLLIPLATVFMASVWSCCAGRSRRTDVWTDVQRFDRVRAALERAATSDVPAPEPPAAESPRPLGRVVRV
ncbi:hypothetical protein [Streptomyces sp. NPDC018610]|uniref:hypothetical protein n=1 Tax=Streptomyces sp. NPDC018610 TaxID=3365049 RepID=UPI0037A64D2D